VLRQQRSAAAIAQWAHEHAATLVAAFHPHRKRVPSEATIRRALRHIEAHLAPSRATIPRTCPSERLWAAGLRGRWQVRPGGGHAWTPHVVGQVVSELSTSEVLTR
jgi:hypothetical protein